jgi:hypothetical protein
MLVPGREVFFWGRGNNYNKTKRKKKIREGTRKRK